MGAPSLWTNINENPQKVEPDHKFKLVFSQHVKLADGSELTNENINQVIKLFSGARNSDPAEITLAINPGKNIVDFTLVGPTTRRNYLCRWCLPSCACSVRTDAQCYQYILKTRRLSNE